MTCRCDAERLLHEITAARPTVALAEHVVDAYSSTRFIEVCIGAGGAVSSTLVLDEIGAARQQVLWSSQRISDPDLIAS
jgi:hypothetical protein